MTDDHESAESDKAPPGDDDEYEEAEEESFPASDPPATWSGPEELPPVASTGRGERAPVRERHELRTDTGKGCRARP
jgi:hypothetical protein